MCFREGDRKGGIDEDVGIKADHHRSCISSRPLGADFDATPELIGQIEVDQAVLLGEADRDFVLRTIELGPRLKRIEGCRERGRARRIPGALVVLLAQPGLKACCEAARFPGGRR